MDRDASEVPSLTESVVSASPSCVAVKVLHAQDVDLIGAKADEVVPPAQVQVYVGSVADLRCRELSSPVRSTSPRECSPWVTQNRRRPSRLVRAVGHSRSIALLASSRTRSMSGCRPSERPPSEGGGRTGERSGTELAAQSSASIAKVFPSGSWNHAIRPPPARGVMPFASCSNSS